MGDNRGQDSKHLGEYAKPGNTHRWQKGKSGNPGGQPSLKLDLERAGAINPDLAGLTPEQARARWWAMLLPIAFAGPQGPKDSNWTYAAGEVGVRLLGKPKETVEIVSDETAAARDPSTMSDDEIRVAREAIATLRRLGHAVAPATDEDVPTEH